MLEITSASATILVHCQAVNVQIPVGSMPRRSIICRDSLRPALQGRASPAISAPSFYGQQRADRWTMQFVPRCRYSVLLACLAAHAKIADRKRGSHLPQNQTHGRASGAKLAWTMWIVLHWRSQNIATLAEAAGLCGRPL